MCPALRFAGVIAGGFGFENFGQTKVVRHTVAVAPLESVGVIRISERKPDRSTKDETSLATEQRKPFTPQDKEGL